MLKRIVFHLTIRNVSLHEMKKTNQQKLKKKNETNEKEEEKTEISLGVK